MLGEAETAIQEILAGKTPALNRGATTAFIKHIMKFAMRTTFSADPKKDVAMYKKLMDYANKHFRIAQQNAVLLAKEVQLAKANAAAAGGEDGGAGNGGGADGGGAPAPFMRGGKPAPTPGGGTPTPAPGPGTPGGAASAAQDIAGALNGGAS